MTWTIIAVLIIVGLIFLILEILVVPGTTFVGIIGFILIVIGIWQSFSVYGNIAGSITLGSCILLTLITLYYSLRSNTWKKFMLKTDIKSKVNVIDEKKIKVGDTGKTVSRLAPAGKALINNVFYEVHTNGGFIDEGREIIILKINYNKIYVKLK
jgi:membrane-bound ClpP family serine protease